MPGIYSRPPAGCGLPLSWFYVDNSIHVDFDGRAYVSSEQWAYAGHIEGDPPGWLTDFQAAAWDHCCRAWRDAVQEDLEAEDRRQYALALGRLK